MARVNIDILTALPAQRGKLTVEHGRFPGVYHWTNTYVTHRGKLAIPVAGLPGTRAKVVRTHAGYGERIFSWIAERLGEIPVCPAMETKNPDEVLMDWDLSPAKAVLLTDGLNHRYLTSGIYYYTLLTEPDLSKGFQMGASPDDITSALENIIKAQHFKDVFK